MIADNDERIPDKEIAQTPSVGRPLRKRGKRKLFIRQFAGSQNFDAVPFQNRDEFLALLYPLLVRIRVQAT